MKGYMVTMRVIGVGLLLGGTFMVIIGGLNSRESVQIGGIVMWLCALPAIMEVKFLRIERRLRKLEGKPTD